ncbi:MAG: hypothetical protein JWP25_7245 [Bradyrhizobium sp.]|nr:hypothetical protein [Bradyrhizobium sp.]
MANSIKVNRKKRGRPATGRDPVSAVRLPVELTASVDRWAEDHDANRSEAIRRLVEAGLTAKTPARPVSNPGRRLRAQELAAKAIERMIDRSAPPEERAQRRRRLTKGPTEFRVDRVDLPKLKK